MSDTHHSQPDDDRSWLAFLNQFLGPQGAQEALNAMRQAGIDPDAMGAAAGLPNDPSQLSAMIGQMQQMLSDAGDNPINTTLAREMARQVLAQNASGESVIVQSQHAQYTQALQVADLWLDTVTDFAPSSGTRSVASRHDWLEACSETLLWLAEPVAVHMVEAMVQTMSGQLGAPGMPLELAESPGAGQFASSLLRPMAAAAFGAQLGHAIGTLACEVFGFCDIGIPLASHHRTGLVAANVEAFADDLEIPFEEVLQFLALREAAAGRLYSAVPWLDSHVSAIIRTYAEGITIDMEALTEALRSVDPTNPDSIRAAMSGGLFQMAQSPEQQAALARLETALAVVEGWVDVVTEQASRAHLPNAHALAEMIRRRRATGGPAEHVFASLVGLELRPARLRDAARLFTLVQRERGIEGRDQLFSHPDLMPSSADLDDPDSFLAMREAEADAEADFDAGLQAILDGTLPFHDAASAHDAETHEDPSIDGDERSKSDEDPDERRGS
ncbi:MAG: zinc-dependent metalloprotease [Bowdeniella nasicola]|nr:zinc-dependent metalloprotease [Bowdeniella nasicola]